MSHLNLEVFRGINGWPDWLAPVLVFFSVALNYLWMKVVLAALVIGMIWRGGHARSAAIRALIAVALANGLTDILKNYDPCPRPCMELPSVALHGIGCGHSMGTASAHSANMAAVAIVFLFYLRWWSAPWFAVALLTGLSRIYIGAHYPWQVLLGWLCGAGIASAVSLIHVDIGLSRGATEPPSDT